MKHKHLSASLDLASAFLASCPVLYEEEPDNLAVRYGAVTFARLLENDIPIEVVSKTSLRSVLIREPQNNLWDDLVWPRSAIIYIVPRGLVKAPEGGSLEFITVARNDAHVPFQVPGCPWQVTDVDSIMVCGGGEGMDFHGVNINKDDFGSAEVDPSIQRYADESIGGLAVRRIAPTETDRAFDFHMFRIGLGLLQTLH
jgi:hypothetical protein